MVVGKDLLRKQDLTFERSSPISLMDLSSIFFNGGRRREDTKIYIFYREYLISKSVYFIISCVMGPTPYIC
jgi:hypothetical protein